MKNKLIFIFFLLSFLISFSLLNAQTCSPTGPCPGGGYWCICNYTDYIGYTGGVYITDSIPNFELAPSEVRDIYLNNHIIGYDSIRLFLNTTITLTLSLSATSSVCTSSLGVQFCLVPASSSGVRYIDFQSTSLSNNVVIPVILQAMNSSSNSTNMSFSVTSYSIQSYNNKDLGKTDDGFIGSLATAFRSIYPDSSTLSYSTKFAYVFVSIMLFFLLYYGIIFFLIKGNVSKLSSFFHYVFFIIIVVLTFYFISISYIPLGVLIVTVLVLAVLGFFRFKSGFTSK